MKALIVLVLVLTLAGCAGSVSNKGVRMAIGNAEVSDQSTKGGSFSDNFLNVFGGVVGLVKGLFPYNQADVNVEITNELPEVVSEQ